MLRALLLAIIWCAAFPAIGQLSKNQGHTVKISGHRFSCYLPQYFEIQEQPPGVIHKASGSFVIVVKVPDDRKVSTAHGLQRSFFEDPRYEILSLSEDKEVKRRDAGHHTYRMLYNLQGFEFERLTTLVTKGDDQYLIIGNYSVKFKDQVQEEVKRIMESFV